MVAKPRGSYSYIDVILDLFVTFPRTSRTNSNRTDPYSVRVRLERNFLGPPLVRFGLEQNKPNKLELALFGKPSLFTNASMVVKFARKADGMAKLLVRSTDVRLMEMMAYAKYYTITR